jgi:hypothetical protein
MPRLRPVGRHVDDLLAARPEHIDHPPVIGPDPIIGALSHVDIRPRGHGAGSHHVQIRAGCRTCMPLARESAIVGIARNSAIYGCAADRI